MELQKVRFNLDADTFEEAEQYLENRFIQLSRHGLKKISIKRFEEKSAVIMLTTLRKSTFVSIYLLKSARGQGKYMEIYREYNYPVLTSEQCKMETFLKKKQIPYTLLQASHSPEYTLVSKFYGDSVTKRTGVHLMNHIDEGLAILVEIGASMNAQRAYCLHPIFQSDENVVEAYRSNKSFKINGRILMLTMEYRSVANEYLSTRTIKSLDEIRLSPLVEVNQMLLADKIQNQKDFLKYHLQTHPRSQELKQYFENWLEKLKPYREPETFVLWNH